MATQNKTTENNNSVHEFMAAIEDERTVKDCLKLVEIMERVSGAKAKMWGIGIVGFDKYHYKYESGREGDSCVIGFAPRKGKLTVYVVDGTSRYPELFEKLGKHTASKVCIYIKKLEDIDLSVLEEILQKSYAYTKSLDGQMHRAG